MDTLVYITILGPHLSLLRLPELQSHPKSMLTVSSHTAAELKFLLLTTLPLRSENAVPIQHGKATTVCLYSALLFSFLEMSQQSSEVIKANAILFIEVRKSA